MDLPLIMACFVSAIANTDSHTIYEWGGEAEEFHPSKMEDTKEPFQADSLILCVFRTLVFPNCFNSRGSMPVIKLATEGSQDPSSGMALGLSFWVIQLPWDGILSSRIRIWGHTSANVFRKKCSTMSFYSICGLKLACFVSYFFWGFFINVVIWH